MARTLELDTIQTPSANNANIQLGSDTVTFSSNIAVDIDNATIDGATIDTSNITVGPGKTLDVQNGTLTTSATQKKAIIEGAGADVDLGAHEVRAETFQSDVATGTAPLTVASTTKVTNLNADKLDGYNSSDLFNLDHADVSGVLDVAHGGTNASTTTANKVFAGPTSGSAAAPSFRSLDRADLPVYQGATSSAVGIKGAVPSATVAQRNQFLKGDGSYATPTDTNTVTSVGTSSSNRTTGNIDIVGGTNVTANKSGGTITIASTDTNTVTSVGTNSSNRSSGNVDIVGGTNVSTSKSGGTITINATDTNTTSLQVKNSSGANQFSGDNIRFAGTGKVSVSFNSSTKQVTFNAADTLGGQAASYFLNAGNMNSGTLSTSRGGTGNSSLKNASIITTSGSSGTFVGGWSTYKINKAYIESNGSSNRYMNYLTHGGQTVTQSYNSSYNYLSTVSDKKWKKNIKDTNVNAVNLIDDLQFKSFDWKEDAPGSGNVKVGLIAQEVDEIIPDWVDHQIVGNGPELLPVDKDGNFLKEPDLVLNPEKMNFYMLKAIQELSTEVKKLKSEIETLKSA